MKLFIITLLCILTFTTTLLALQTYFIIQPFNDFATAYNEYVNTTDVKNNDKNLKNMLVAWRKLAVSQRWKLECEE